MLSKREQDPETAVHFRSDRVSRVNGLYFFSTRENTLEGPFFSKEDAARETEAYVRRMQGARPSQTEHPLPPEWLTSGMIVAKRLLPHRRNLPLDQRIERP